MYVHNTFTVIHNLLHHQINNYNVHAMWDQTTNLMTADNSSTVLLFQAKWYILMYYLINFRCWILHDSSCCQCSNINVSTPWNLLFVYTGAMYLSKLQEKCACRFVRANKCNYSPILHVFIVSFHIIIGCAILIKVGEKKIKVI